MVSKLVTLLLVLNENKLNCCFVCFDKNIFKCKYFQVKIFECLVWSQHLKMHHKPSHHQPAQSPLSWHKSDHPPITHTQTSQQILRKNTTINQFKLKLVNKKIKQKQNLNLDHQISFVENDIQRIAIPWKFKPPTFSFQP